PPSLATTFPYTTLFRSRVGEQIAVGRPALLFRSQPADALDERAGDLAAIDARIDRLADVHQQIAAQYPHHPGEAIDLHLGHGGSLREVEERRPAAFVDVPVDSLGRIEAALAEADAIVIGGGDEI